MFFSAIRLPTQQHRLVSFLTKLLLITALYFRLKLYVFEGVSYVEIGLTKHLNTDESLYFFIRLFDSFSNNFVIKSLTYFTFSPVFALTSKNVSAFIDCLYFLPSSNVTLLIPFWQSKSNLAPTKKMIVSGWEFSLIYFSQPDNYTKLSLLSNE